jgi:tRNA(Ile)-lysidine synthase
MDQLQSDLDRQLRPFMGRSRFWVAFSGGVDSTVLLHATAACLALWPQTQRPELRAVHINHGLQSQADSWQQACVDFCQTLNISCDTVSVSISGSRQGLEKMAREARYQAFEAFVESNELLLLGHHQDDQVETFFIRLLRGSGPMGLSGMPPFRDLGRGQLLRPLLTQRRQQLKDYAHHAGLEWQEDPSNDDVRFTRNFLRHKLMPVLAEYWPDYAGRLSRVMGLQRDAAQLLSEYLSEDLATLLNREGGLDLRGLAGYSSQRQRALLRQFALQFAGVNLQVAQLEQLCQQMLASEPDAQPEMQIAGHRFLRFQQCLFCLPMTAGVVEPQLLPWSLNDKLSLPAGGSLLLRREGHFRPQGQLEVRFRQGGERCQLPGRNGRHKLKKLLQDWGIPPWLRENVPLIYCDGELAAVADLAVCQPFYVADPQQGLTVVWHRH